MAWQGLDDETVPFVASDDLVPQESLLPAGWEAARQYHRLKKILVDSRHREKVRREAVRAVLHQARELLRHSARPGVHVLLPWPDAPQGDLELEATVEEAPLPSRLEPQEVLVSQREFRRADLVLILDMSLSMTGEKVALLATAVAVLALQLPSTDLSLVVFDHEARVLKAPGELLSAEDMISRVLEVKAEGYTSIEAGMRRGASVLRRGRLPQRMGLLVTDGVYNVGFDPTPLAGRYPRLHVIKIGEGVQDRGLCQHLAAAGKGHLHVLPDYEGLPHLARRLVGELFR